MVALRKVCSLLLSLCARHAVSTQHSRDTLLLYWFYIFGVDKLLQAPTGTLAMPASVLYYTQHHFGFCSFPPCCGFGVEPCSHLAAFCGAAAAVPNRWRRRTNGVCVSAALGPQNITALSYVQYRVSRCRKQIVKRNVIKWWRAQYQILCTRNFILFGMSRTELDP